MLTAGLLMVYVCEGSDREKLDWFRIINIAGERLTDQELRNAVYAGEWLHAAKKYFRFGTVAQDPAKLEKRIVALFRIFCTDRGIRILV